MGLSWFGKIATGQMMVLPKFLFLFQNMVATIPQRTPNEIQRIINVFVWGRVEARIKASKIHNQIRTGGLAIPNITAYCHAAMLANIYAMVEQIKLKKFGVGTAGDSDLKERTI